MRQPPSIPHRIHPQEAKATSPRPSEAPLKSAHTATNRRLFAAGLRLCCRQRPPTLPTKAATTSPMRTRRGKCESCDESIGWPPQSGTIKAKRMRINRLPTVAVCGLQRCLRGKAPATEPAVRRSAARGERMGRSPQQSWRKRHCRQRSLLLPPFQPLLRAHSVACRQSTRHSLPPTNSLDKRGEEPRRWERGKKLNPHSFVCPHEKVGSLLLLLLMPL